MNIAIRNILSKETLIVRKDLIKKNKELLSQILSNMQLMMSLLVEFDIQLSQQHQLGYSWDDPPYPIDGWVTHTTPEQPLGNGWDDPPYHIDNWVTHTTQEEYPYPMDDWVTHTTPEDKPLGYYSNTDIHSSYPTHPTDVLQMSEQLTSNDGCWDNPYQYDWVTHTTSEDLPLDNGWNDQPYTIDNWVMPTYTTC